MRQASLQVTSSLELKPVLSEILRQTLTLAGASDAHLFLYENERLTFGAALWAQAGEQQSFQSVRQGGLTREDVLNALPVDRFRAALRRNR